MPRLPGHAIFNVDQARSHPINVNLPVGHRTGVPCCKSTGDSIPLLQATSACRLIPIQGTMSPAARRIH